jgi:hypothetical protein
MDLANDKYRAQLRATYIMDPADASLQVDAIPENLPTLVTVGWNTQYETVFRVTGTSGTNSSNYALTGLTKIKGYDGNLPEDLAVNCLNHEEYFNQYSEAIDDIQAVADAAGASAIAVTTIASSSTPTPTRTTTRTKLNITALAANATFGAPSGTPSDGDSLIIRVKDNGTARTLAFNAIYRALGVSLPTTTVISKTMYLAMIYNAADSKWDVLAVNNEA